MEHNLSDTNFFGTEKIGKILLKIAPPVMIAQLIQALDRADDYIKEKPEDAAKLVADDFGVEEDVMEKILSNLTFTTELTTDDIDEIKKVKDFSLEEGIIGSDVDIDSFINTEYLDAVEK